MPKIGILGGSGFYEIPGLAVKEYKKVETPFGNPSHLYMIGEFSGREIVFLPRHGSPHHIPPHRVNYRANIWGFKELGTERIMSVSAVGGISSKMRPGTIVIPDQIVDMTSGREPTFYDGEEVTHIDFTEPYCPVLREYIGRAGKKLGIPLMKSGTYVCVNGPRFETKAEIRMFLKNGIDIVGMTAMPEASLAREVELCYAGITIITNYAAGLKERRLTATEVMEMMKRASSQVGSLLRKVISIIPVERKCTCKEALKEARW